LSSVEAGGSTAFINANFSVPVVKCNNHHGSLTVHIYISCLTSQVSMNLEPLTEAYNGSSLGPTKDISPDRMHVPKLTVPLQPISFSAGGRFGRSKAGDVEVTRAVSSKVTVEAPPLDHPRLNVGTPQKPLTEPSNHPRIQTSPFKSSQQVEEDPEVLLHALLMVPDGKNFKCGPLQAPNVFLNCKLDPKITQLLLQAQYPVLGVDCYMPVIDVFSGSSRGNLRVLLAMGRAEQIVSLQRTRDEEYDSLSHVVRPVNTAQVKIMREHVFVIRVEKVSGLTPLQSTVWGEADCYVQTEGHSGFQPQPSGLLDVCIRYKHRPVQPEGQAGRGTASRVVTLVVQVHRASGLKAAARAISEENDQFSYLMDVGLNPYITVHLSFLPETERRCTRTAARTFCPEFDHHIEVTCDMLLHMSSGETCSLAEQLEQASAVFTVWNRDNHKG
ncbi:hypothetical protein XENOCAPTIV_028553, partial [Xenoophorus captivus]